MFFNGRHYNNKDDYFSVGGRKCHALSRSLIIEFSTNK